MTSQPDPAPLSLDMTDRDERDTSIDRIVEALDEYDVAFLVAGDAALRLWGIDNIDIDVDVEALVDTDRTNLDRIVELLHDHNGQLRVDGLDPAAARRVTATVTDRWLARLNTSSWTLDIGHVNICTAIAGDNAHRYTFAELADTAHSAQLDTTSVLIIDRQELAAILPTRGRPRELIDRVAPIPGLDLD